MAKSDPVIGRSNCPHCHKLVFLRVDKERNIYFDEDGEYIPEEKP